MRLNYLLSCCYFPLIFSLNSFALPEETITIAAFYNNSGTQSVLDTFSANGAKLALDSINQSGGVLGKKLNIIFFDGKSDPRLLALQAQQVAKNPNIFITFGLTDTDMALAVIPPIAKENKLFITSGATSPKLPLLAPKSVFLACFSDDRQAKIAAQFSFNDLHAKKSLIIEQKAYEYANILSNFYNKEWQSLSKNKDSIKTILVNENLSQKKDIEDTIKNLKPDIIFIAADPKTIISTAQFLRSISYSKPLIGGDAFDSNEIKSIKGGEIYYTAHAFVSKENPDPIVQIFIKQYEDKFKQEPDSSFAALGFDTVYLLAHAITLSTSTDPKKVSDTLHKIKNYHLITGNVSYSPQSNIPEKSLTIINVHEGRKNIAKVID